MSIRVIHIGVGVRGRHWLDVVASHPDFVSAACVDQDETALEAARSCPGQEHGLFSTRLKETLQEVQADAALIVTPSFLHYEHTTLALEAGLAVLVEKPLAFTLSEAAASIELARKLNKPLMVAENFRFFQAERTVRQLLDEGRAGQIGSVNCIDRRDQPSHSQGAWVKSMPDPFLNEIAVHHFDSFRYLFNSQPRAILSRSYDPPGSDYDSGAAMEALIELQSGVRIQYSGTLVATRYEYDLRIEGDKGEIRTDRKSVSWRPAGAGSFEKVDLVPVPRGDELPYPRAGTVSLLNQFRDAVLQGAEPETSGRDNIWTLAMVQAAKQSQEQHREVSLSDAFTPDLRRQAGIDETSELNRTKLVAPVRTMSGRRVLFIGLDAGDAELIEQWEKEGFLPNIAALRARGVSGRLGTTAEIVHVSAWPSIFTGVTPDKHGLYHAYVMNAGEQSPVRPRPDLSPFPFFWKLVNDTGLRSVVMDAFMTCPLQNFNGSQIVEWGTWSWFCEPSVSPPSLKAEIESRFGPYPAPEHSKVAAMPESRWFRDILVSAVDHKTEVIKWLMQREDWDLFLTVFGETHPAGHYLWHLHDPSYPGHPPSLDPEVRHALRDVHVAIDKGIGEIIKLADENTTVFLVSGDGMGPNYSASHLLEELLQTMGLLAVAGKNGAEAANKTKLSRDQLLSRLRSMVPQSLRTAISQKFFSHSMKEKLALKWLTAGIAWDQTRAFLISNANEGFVRINLQGREPQGIVQPGAEYARLIEEICQVIRTMTSSSGVPVAKAVHKTDDIFDGPRRNQMPDIIVNWNPEAEVTDHLLTQQFGRIETKEPGYGIVPFYVGNHRPNAFAIVAGPGIGEGESLGGGHTLDLTPTLLSLLDIRPPEYMDGRVLSELCGRTEMLAR